MSDMIDGLKEFQRKFIEQDPSRLLWCMDSRKKFSETDVTPREYLRDLGFDEEKIKVILHRAGLE